MTARIPSALLMCASLVIAAGSMGTLYAVKAQAASMGVASVAEAAHPAATLAAAQAATQATTQASTPNNEGAAEAHPLPSPADILQKIKGQRAANEKLINVAYIDLIAPVAEKPEGFALIGNPDTLTVHSLIERLHQARDDKSIKALLMVFGDTHFNLAQAQEIRGALAQLHTAGKRTFVYADSYDTDTYVAASGATDICILGGGEIMMPGVGLETIFAKSLLDKVGVTADYVQIGEYKGADEEFTRTGASPELKGELNKLVDSLYNLIVDGVSTYRHLPPDAVKDAIDQAIITGKSAKKRELVDHLVDEDGLRPLLKTELGGDINLIHDYGDAGREKLDLSNPFAFFALLVKRPETSDKPSVAIIHAEGVIVDGDSEGSLFGGEGNIGGENIRKAFRMAARDDSVKAIVLRIDSPGGSALASEVMWQAAHHAAEKKPIIVSVGSMAASGGYYLASAGNYIFADPSAIVGSIGVVGGKFVYKDLFAKLGLNTESFTRGSNAALFSADEPFSDKQRAMVTSWMKETYVQFTERVMTNRANKIKDIDKVARGRIFIAAEAKSLGMVDELGGIEDAIAYAAKQGGLKAGQYDVKIIPPARTLADLLSGSDDDEDSAMPFRPKLNLTLSPDSLLRTVSPSVRQSLAQQLQMMRLLEQRPVLLVSPYVLTVQ